MKQIFRQIISDYRKTLLPEGKLRLLKIPAESKKIITIIGPRRSGKTYFLYQMINELKKSVPGRNILYINFEDERLTVEADQLQSLLDAFYELTPDIQGEVYFFFDEIQNINGWEKFIRRLYDTVSKNIFITGSSAKLLSREIATNLRGRALSYELLPFSFREYLNFRGIEVTDTDSTGNKALISSAFNQFLVSGGFPECINFPAELRIRTLQSYFEAMMYRDIVERFNINNITALRYFLKRNVANIASKVSYNKIYNDLRSQGIKISKESVNEFFRYTEDCYLFFPVTLYSESVLKQTMNEKKIYCIDNGLAGSVSFSLSENAGHLLENLIYIELKAREYTIHYFNGKNECDFICFTADQPVLAVQVCLQINKENEKRETAGLIEALNSFNLERGYILTLDQSEEITISGKTISIVPARKWLIEH